jgi:aromatic-L-amino-acid decarboxylase
VDDGRAMRAGALDARLSEDRQSGLTPLAVVATVGTTSSTAVDPLAGIAEVCHRHGAWLHVDAAYAGVTAMLPECRPLFEGLGEADSIVVNPHKWLFTPFDLSVLFCRRMDVLRAAFSLVPEYLRTREASPVQNLMDTGIQLGRRFRALKLWMVLRHFGAEGIRERLAGHIRLARLFASWVDAEPGFERVAEVPFSVVCFRYAPAGLTDEALDELNERLLDRVNGSGEVFLSHTRLENRYVLRLAVGHIRTTEVHLARAWELLRQESARQDR